MTHQEFFKVLIGDPPPEIELEIEIKKREVEALPDELIKQYCLERNNGIDAEQFFDFYESKNWYVGKNKMKNWQAAIRTWEKRKTKTSKIDAQLDNYNNAKKHLGL